MDGYIIKKSCLTRSVKRLVQRSLGLYYFRKENLRRLPQSYKGKREIDQSLQTQNENKAIQAMIKLNESGRFMMFLSHLL